MRASVTLTVEFEATVDIDTLEAQVQAAGRAAIGQVLMVAARELEVLAPRCGWCGATQGCWAGHDPRVVSTMCGRVVLPRRR